MQKELHECVQHIQDPPTLRAHVTAMYKSNVNVDLPRNEMDANVIHEYHRHKVSRPFCYFGLSRTCRSRCWDCPIFPPRRLAKPTVVSNLTYLSQESARCNQSSIGCLPTLAFHVTIKQWWDSSCHCCRTPYIWLRYKLVWKHLGRCILYLVRHSILLYHRKYAKVHWRPQSLQHLLSNAPHNLAALTLVVSLSFEMSLKVSLSAGSARLW